MDLGSGIRKKPIPDPGFRGQKGITSYRVPYGTKINIFSLTQKNIKLDWTDNERIERIIYIIRYGTE
jgi:hypothetical protein